MGLGGMGIRKQYRTQPPHATPCAISRGEDHVLILIIYAPSHLHCQAMQRIRATGGIILVMQALD